MENISEETKNKAIDWWNGFTDQEKVILSLKHYNILDLNQKQIVFVWRRCTGGEWKSLLEK
jgi:hypothetical protein